MHGWRQGRTWISGTKPKLRWSLARLCSEFWGRFSVRLRKKVAVTSNTGSPRTAYNGYSFCLCVSKLVDWKNASGFKQAADKVIGYHWGQDQENGLDSRR